MRYFPRIHEKKIYTKKEKKRYERDFGRLEFVFGIG
jgi:hypothetical protein